MRIRTAVICVVAVASLAEPQANAQPSPPGGNLSETVVVRTWQADGPLTCEVRTDGARRCVRGRTFSRRSSRWRLASGFLLLSLGASVALLGAAIDGDCHYAGCSDGTGAYIASGVIGLSGIAAIAIGGVRLHRLTGAEQRLDRLQFSIGPMVGASNSGLTAGLVLLVRRL